MCFNPFFIRASVYCQDNCAAIGSIVFSFNPFFIRASVYWFWLTTGGTQTKLRFQSLLHQGISLLPPYPNASPMAFRVFQSLLHQGISLLRLNPCDPACTICGAFQSLLHQGISLLRLAVPACPSSLRPVSIPSSSGHQFTEQVVWLYGIYAVAVSIPSSSGHQFTACLSAIRASKSIIVSIPSSSGHQFTGQ